MQVSSIEFLDDELDDKELGGDVTWLPPEDMAQATPKHACLPPYVSPASGHCVPVLVP